MKNVEDIRSDFDLLELQQMDIDSPFGTFRLEVELGSELEFQKSGQVKNEAFLSSAFTRKKVLIASESGGSEMLFRQEEFFEKVFSMLPEAFKKLQSECELQ